MAKPSRRATAAPAAIRADPQQRTADRLGGVAAWTLTCAPLRLLASRASLSLLEWQGTRPPRSTTLLRRIPPDARAPLLQEVRRCLREGGGLDRVLPVRTFGQRTITVRVVAEALPRGSGMPPALQGACQDITQQAERARRALLFAQRLTRTMETITEGFLMLERDWRVAYMNPAAERMLRQPSRDFLGRVLWECLPHARNSAFHHYFERALAENQPYTFQEYWPPLSMWVEARAYPNEEGLAVYLTDVTQARATETELQKYRTHLEELVAQRTRELAHINEELTGFTLAVAHDLRAPLAAIMGFGQALAERLGPGADRKSTHYLGRLQSAAQRMEDMVNGLIELARVGQAPLHPRTVNVSAVAADVVQILRATSTGRTVQVEIQPELTARADPQLFRVVLDNLLGNAWKFSTGRNPALIEVGHDPGQQAFYVRDNGAGFEMAYANNLFAPFQRLHPEGEFEGPGIGLAAVRRVVQRHGGVVWAESEPGAGTTIWFTLP